MVESEYSLSPGGDKPKQKPPSPLTKEDQSPERVYGIDRRVKKGNSMKSDKAVDEIQEKASAILTFSLEFEKIEEELEKKEEMIEMREKGIGLLEESISEKVRELEEKDIESDLRQVFEATLVRLVIKKQSEEVVTQLESEENKLCLIAKKLKEMVSEFERKNEEAGLLFESIIEAEKDLDLKLRVEIDIRKEESKQLEAKKNELRLLEVAMDEKTAELKKKEEAFELKLIEEAEKLREETEKPKHQVVETRKRSNLDYFEPPLLVEKESDAASSLTRLAKRHKSQEEEVLDEDLKPLTFPDTKFNDFNKSMSAFGVDQVWALYDARDDMPRIYAQIRTVFSSESSLQVTLLEHVETTKDEKCIIPRASCGRFEYGDTEIKSHLMFAHEMQYIKCGKDIIVNLRKGETWALFRDWNTSSWNDHMGPPYRYDFVEVISEFDDSLGIAVAYMGRVEGFLSVFNHAAQHGLIKIMISPEEMVRFSHKVESVKLSGEEKEGSFELNPVAAPSYHLVLEEDQDGSTQDLAIIID